MYWEKEFNTRDKDVRHLWAEHWVVVGAFTGLVILGLIIGVTL